MTLPSLILAASALIFATVLAIADFRSHRIPNRLTVSAAMIALLVNIGIAGLGGAFRSTAGLAVGLAVFLPFFLAGKFGAGDVKGMAAVGAFLGPSGVVLAAVGTLIAGLVGGLIFLVMSGGLAAVGSMFQRWKFRTFVLCTTGKRAWLEPSAGDPARARFPYGFAIACGTAASVFLGAIR